LTWKHLADSTSDIALNPKMALIGGAHLNESILLSRAKAALVDRRIRVVETNRLDGLNATAVRSGFGCIASGRPSAMSITGL